MTPTKRQSGMNPRRAAPIPPPPVTVPDLPVVQIDPRSIVGYVTALSMPGLYTSTTLHINALITDEWAALIKSRDPFRFDTAKLLPELEGMTVQADSFQGQMMNSGYFYSLTVSETKDSPRAAHAREIVNTFRTFPRKRKSK